MFIGENRTLPDGRYLLRAGLAWTVSAAVLLLAGTLAANSLGLGEQGLGIVSSAVSFLSAFAAGIAAARGYTGQRLIVSLTTATALVIFLLTVGFLIKGEEMNSSAILSIVSFTYAGVFSGTILPPRKKAGKRYHAAKLT